MTRWKPSARTLSGLHCICLLAGLSAATWAQACTLPKDAVTVQSSQVALDGRMFTVASQSLADLDHARSRLLVLDGRCRSAWSAVVEGAVSHFDVRVLGGMQLLQFVTLQVAGDATGYVHRLLEVRGGRIMQALAPVEHTGRDGFYFGPLPHGRQQGLFTWTADPRGEAEAAPHPFILRTWVWSGNRLTGPAQTETIQKYAAPTGAPDRADFVAKALGLPFRDQTGDTSSRFKDFDRVEGQVQDLAIRQAAER